MGAEQEVMQTLLGEEAMKAEAAESGGSEVKQEPAAENALFSDKSEEGGAEKGEAEKGEAEKGEAEKGEAEKGEAEKGSAPEEYEDFELPDGVVLDKDALAEFLPVAKELNLTQEQAQKLVDIQAKAMSKLQETVSAQVTKSVEDLRNQWNEEIKNDETIGGADFNKNIAVAVKAMRKFGSPQLVKVLESTGMGDNPELIRFMYKVGKAISEDSLTDQKNGEGVPRSAAEVLFGGNS